MSAKITLSQTDITLLNVDAIVNAANQGLLGGGGVDGAIHAAAGKALVEECLKLPQTKPGCRCPTGEARITGSGKLPCKKVIHTVGPIYRDGKHGESGLLADCYRNSLLLAEQNGLETIAFPNISTGIYGYPKDEAAKVAVDTVKETLAQCPHIKEVKFVCFDRENLDLYSGLV
jgi:O-acetyl-ADP-ribose deacetylase (regulator of RNase III)